MTREKRYNGKLCIKCNERIIHAKKLCSRCYTRETKYKRNSLHTNLSDEKYQKVKLICQELGITIYKFLNLLIDDYFKIIEE